MGICRSNAYSGGILGLIFSAGPVAKLVILILLVFSVISWTIILVQVATAERGQPRRPEVSQDRPGCRFVQASHRHVHRQPGQPLLQAAPRIVQGVYPEAEGGRRTPLNLACRRERAQDHRLAGDRETGKKDIVSRHYGKYGALHRPLRDGMGYHRFFQGDRSRGTTSLAVVAPGISEALIATALGLFAAIPAVLGYNILVG